MKNRIVILQHNVSNWKTNSSNHYNVYRQQDPDVLILNETGLKNEEELKIFPYLCYKINHSNELHDGSIIAVKRNLKHTLIKLDRHNIICIRLETSLGAINLATTYLPPRRPQFPYEEILNLFNRQEPTYVIGDFNATHPTFGNATTNQKGRALLQLMNRGTVQHHGPSFKTWFGHASSTPDKVLSNNKVVHNMIIQRGDPTSNDHIPILITISSNPIAIETPPCYDIANTNWDKYYDKLRTYKVKNLEYAKVEQIEEELTHVTELIQCAIKESTPLKKYRILPAPKLPHDVKLLQIQYTALIKNINNLRLIDVINQRRIYQIRNELQEKLRDHSKNMWNRMLAKIDTNNPKKFWGSVNKLLGHDTRESKYIIGQNNNKLEKEEDIADEFKNIMEEVFSGNDNPTCNFDNLFKQEVISYLNEEAQHRLHHYDSASVMRHDQDLLKKIEYDELCTCINSMKNRAPGKSGIMQRHLKEAVPSILEGYCSIFNACITAGYFPMQYKTATVKMALKPGKIPTQSTNYRPISLLEVPGKIFEKVINQRLIKFWNSNGFFNEQQFGFRPGRGTLHAIAIATEKIAKNMSVKSCNSIIFRDVSKAFDKVWHDGLHYKLLKSNLPICMEKLLSEFLANRKAFIKYKNIETATFNLKTGVAQGGCISPTLYIYYVHDIPPPIYNSNEDIHFADDITQIITTRGSSQRFHAKHIAKEVERINKFERKWRISTNSTKFKVVPINNKISARAELRIDGKIQNYASEGNFLGTDITNTGYCRHVTNKVARAREQLIKLKRFSRLSSNIKCQLYKGLVRPILEYPPIPLHGLSGNNIKKLQRIQNKATRFITNTSYPTLVRSEILHQICNLKPLNQRLHERAKNIWESINKQQYQMMLRLQMQEQGELKYVQFPSSLKKINFGGIPSATY